ncbi:acyltransferase [Gordonia sp. SID5947]|uniref:acyltransferase n=1 Tax=Gordonia sp. SID5947 TaxID=2690315 RepID=UPI0031BAF47B
MKPSAGRAHTADFVRVLLFAGVVIAHSVNAINTSPDVIRSANLVGTFCHLTRYGFVAVTLFVLVLSTRGKPMTPVAFWRRRFGLVVGPYLVWTLLYSLTDHVVIADNPWPGPGTFFSNLAQDVVTGEGKYQLYFLLISMQIYLAFPLVSWVLDRTAHRPWRVLGVAAVIQMASFVFYQYLPRPSGPTWTLVYDNLWKTLPMYALFVAIGALAAVHHEAMNEWLRSHAVAVISACGIGTAFSVGGYLLATSPGNVPLQANTPWNPVSLPWFLAGLTLLWMIALVWNARRESRGALSSRTVSYASFRAFGVFAVHPLILDILGRVGFIDALFEWFPNSAAIRTTLLTALVLTMSLVVVDILLRTPVSKWLTARSRVPLRRPRKSAADSVDRETAEPTAVAVATPGT